MDGIVMQAAELIWQRMEQLRDYHDIPGDLKGVSRELDCLSLAFEWLMDAEDARDKEERAERGPHWLACRACRRASAADA